MSLQLLSRHQALDRVASGGAPPAGAALPGSRTAAELVADAKVVSARLASLPRGGEVALACHDRYLFAVALLAAWERELVVALPPNTQPEMLKLLRGGGNVLTVLHDQDGVPGIDVRALAYGPPSSASELARPLPLPPDRRVVVVYTSGSTGTPMACPKTAGQIVGEALGLERTFHVRTGDRFVPTVPAHHIYGLLFGVLVPLVSGGSFCRETPFHAEEVHAILERDAARVLVSVPAHLRALRIMSAEGLAVSRVFSSGAPLPAETWQMLFERFGWRVVEVLGSSETGGIAWRDTSGAPFEVFEGLAVRVGDGARMILDSPYLPPGSQRGWTANDRIEMVGERAFKHLGRSDGVLKVGSTRVSLAELEARIASIPGVADVALVGVEVGGARGHESWAVVAGQGLTVPGIRAKLLEWLDVVVLPRRFRIVDAIPRESTGKVRREVLLALFEKEPS